MLQKQYRKKIPINESTSIFKFFLYILHFVFFYLFKYILDKLLILLPREIMYYVFMLFSRYKYAVIPYVVRLF